MKPYIVALDQGTTGTRAIIFDRQQNIIGQSSRSNPQLYPQPGFVEHDPMDIFACQYAVLTEVLVKCQISPEQLAGIGIANQRETTVLWDRETGRPIYNAIVWQCRRTADLCEQLKRQGLEPIIQQKTGLKIDAYFSATKIKWILDHVEGVREKAERGEVLFGTIDSWLVWKLTGGKVHVTDYTNASRTMLFNIHTMQWDEDICRLLDIPMEMLPHVCRSSQVYGTWKLNGVEVPIAGMAGDQQAALFGQTCFQAGQAKNTYGTGCFLLMHTGDQPVHSKNGLLTTLACQLDEHPKYALEGSVFVAGAVMQWLKEGLRFFGDSSDAEYYAAKMTDNGGVYVVPAFTGLGAPYWDMYARGGIFGLTRGTKREHIVRACDEAIAYQCRDLLDAMEADTGIHLAELRVDGGASRDNFLMQFQADILDTCVCRPQVLETTALGAAYLAGLAVGYWQDLDEISALHQTERRFCAAMQQQERTRLLKGWHKAVDRCLGWAADE